MQIKFCAIIKDEFLEGKKYALDFIQQRKTRV